LFPGPYNQKGDAHVPHPSVILCPWRSGRVVHNPPRVAYIAGWDHLRVVSRPQSPQTGCSILIGSSQWLRHYGRPQVIGHSVGESVHPIFIGSTRRSGWVERLSPYLSLNRLLYVSWKLKKKSSYSIQKNNSLRNKMVEQTYHEVLSAVVDKLLHPSLAIFTPHVRFHKQLYWGRLTSKRRSL